jgi:hypothetical protein
VIRYVLATGAWARAEGLERALVRAARLPGESASVASTRCECPGLALVACVRATGPRPRRVWSDASGMLALDGVADLEPELFSGDGTAAGVWARLSGGAEGQFTAVRLERGAERAELRNDALGLNQAYWRADERGMLVSNSVRVIQELAGDAALDEEGACLYL